MKLKASSGKPDGLSPPDCDGDPEGKEISDEDDDDRNHKHRRREDTRSQSMERDSLDQPFPRHFRKQNRMFENGHSYHDNESHASGTWKNYNSPSLERRRPGSTSFPRDQRDRANQPFTGDSGPGRGRGRDSGSWIQRDSEFNSVDMASRMVLQGPVAPNFFGGRGLPSATNAQNPSWGAFGLMPGITNGSLDTLHPIGLQGMLRPSMSSSLNLGIPRQRCRDFEERGFCLRGDICPMEHGVNRIVIEDVQSLSQFNLPGSLPNGQPAAGPGPLACESAPSTTSMHSRPVHNKSSQPGVADDDMGLNDAYTPDLYDPDQPLWNDSGPEASAALSTLESAGETETFYNNNLSDHHHVRSRYNGIDNPVRSSGSHSSSSSVWGRIGRSRNGLDAKEKNDATSSGYCENEAKEAGNPLPTSESTFRPGKQTSADDNGSKALDSTLKSQSDGNRNFRRPSQKAQRTLFLNGIPEESNKRGALLAHFSKFGEVVDIHIPFNTPRAFVQFSKREEAEAALNAPDAVMGNRFIRLWWANRDNISDEVTRSAKFVPPVLHVPTAASISSQLSTANREKSNLQPLAEKSNTHQRGDAPVSDSPRSVGANAMKVLPPSQKKLETLEQLKEELRKKQEMLDKKRNDFRQQLERFAKQATGAKNELVTEQAAKRHKVGLAADPAKSATPKSSNPVAAVGSPGIKVEPASNKSSQGLAADPAKSATPKSSNPGAAVGTPGIKVEPASNKSSQLVVSPSSVSSTTIMLAGTPSNDSANDKKPTSTLPLDANVQSEEKLLSNASMEAIVSGNGETSNS